MNVRISSWNILNDFQAHTHPKQIERLPQITDEIKKMAADKARVILYLCEIQTPENLKIIEQETGLVAVGEPERYIRDIGLFDRKGQSVQWSGFLADSLTAEEAVVERLKIVDDEHDMLLSMRFQGLNILGFHIPSRTLSDWRLRKAHATKVLDEQPDIFMGDSNSMSFYRARHRFRQAGYTEAHSSAPPPFPHPYYRGKNDPFWLPTITIDVLEHKPELLSQDAQYSLVQASDHPLIWADFELE